MNTKFLLLLLSVQNSKFRDEYADLCISPRKKRVFIDIWKLNGEKHAFDKLVIFI